MKDDKLLAGVKERQQNWDVVLKAKTGLRPSPWNAHSIKNNP